MRERLLIVGAGDFGREVFCWARQVPAEWRSWEIGGFLDYEPGRLDGYGLPVAIVGSPATHPFSPEDRVVLAIPDPAERRALAGWLVERGAQFTSMVHPSVTMGLNNSWGVGCIICPGVFINTNVRMGKHVIVGCYAGLGHDVVIGDYCTLGAHLGITGHGYLEEDVVLGINVATVPHARLGRAAVVEPGSVVLREVPPGAQVRGVPARLVSQTRPGMAASLS